MQDELSHHENYDHIADYSIHVLAVACMLARWALARLRDDQQMIGNCEAQSEPMNLSFRLDVDWVDEKREHRELAQVIVDNQDMLALICFGGYCGGVTDLSALPASLREFIEATNAADPLRFLAVFSDEAIIDDWGRKFVGRDEIASWDQTDNIGVRAQFELVDYAMLAGDHVLRLRVTSDRFNGVGSLRFMLGADGLITGLVIS